MTRRSTLLAFLVVLALFAASVDASPLTIMVGDNDGYGLGIADGGTASWSNPPYDGRSAAEAAATNGAQITDVYSAIFPGFGPSGSNTASVFFPFAGLLQSGSLTVDMGDFQATLGGQISVSFNGVLQPNLFGFDDGFQNTAVRTFVLDATSLANANAAQQFVVTLDHGNSGDFIAFDYFQLDGTLADLAVPEPSTIAVWSLLASALGAFCVRRRASTAVR